MKRVPENLKDKYTDVDFKDYQTFHEYFHTDEGFDKAYKNGYEMWINCKEYYYINIGSPIREELIK